MGRSSTNLLTPHGHRLVAAAALGWLAACGAGPGPGATLGAGTSSAPATGTEATSPAPVESAVASAVAQASASVPGPSSPAASGSTEPAAAQSDPPADLGEPPPLPQGTKVLQVGDSMADALGKDLGHELEARGVKSFLKAKEATYIPEWAGFSMGLKSLLLEHRPDLVIITLGGNEVAMRDPSVRAEPVRKIVETIGDRPCVWVGAPLWGPHTGILDVIRSNCAPCRFVDTNALVPNLQRLKDGVHPTLPERKRWAKAMVEWLARQRDPHGKRPWDLKPE